MICVKCGHNNTQNEKYCSNCKAQLPNYFNNENPELPKVNERYLQFKNAGEKVKVGEWTVDQYAEFLEEMSSILSQKEQEIREIEIPEEDFEDFREELEAGFAGIELYTSGIEEMKLFVDDMNAEHIDQGLEKIFSGNEKINEAMRINRQSHKELEDQYPFISNLYVR